MEIQAVDDPKPVINLLELKALKQQAIRWLPQKHGYFFQCFFKAGF